MLRVGRDTSSGVLHGTACRCGCVGRPRGRGKQVTVPSSPLCALAPVLALVLAVAFLVVHAVLRMRTGIGGYQRVLWWALSALPIAAAGVAYQRCIETGSGLWWFAFAATVAAGIAWGLYGVLRAIPMLRRDRPSG